LTDWTLEKELDAVIAKVGESMCLARDVGEHLKEKNSVFAS